MPLERQDAFPRPQVPNARERIEAARRDQGAVHVERDAVDGAAVALLPRGRTSTVDLIGSGRIAGSIRWIDEAFNRDSGSGGGAPQK